MKIDDTVETHLKKHDIENLDSFRFSMTTKDVFKELNAEPDSDESSDSSDEGTDNGSEPMTTRAPAVQTIKSHPVVLAVVLVPLNPKP